MRSAICSGSVGVSAAGLNIEVGEAVACGVLPVRCTTITVARMSTFGLL
jgi:hypothetical protein